MPTEGEHVPGYVPEAYEGGRPYIAVSYARADGGAARAIIGALANEGYRVWWDKGIEGGSRFSDRIADRVHDCACVVMLISRTSVASDWCMDEVAYALDLKKNILPIYLEPVELPRALRLRLGRLQALFWYKYETDEEFNADLFAVRMLDQCLTKDGKSGRGVKARDAEVPEADEAANTEEETDGDNPTPQSQQTESCDDEREGEARWRSNVTRVVATVVAIVIGLLIGTVLRNAILSVRHQDEAPVEIQIDSLIDETVQKELVQGVSVRDEFDAYTWDELKRLSRAIADARNNEDWLEIARQYHLVDEDGKLQGDEKVVTFDDGWRTSVRILGFRHDVMADGGRSGITFEFADVPITHWMNTDWTNAEGWEKSHMREWLNSEFLSSLPSGLQSCIESVKKETNNVGRVESEDDTSVVTATDDKLWLLSMTEVYGSTTGVWSSATYDAEGTQYKLYADQGVTTKNYGFCAKGGADYWWWLRSPNAGDSGSFHYVDPVGGWDAQDARYEWGVFPGFCF
jgi:hypothetical protein